MYCQLVTFALDWFHIRSLVISVGCWIFGAGNDLDWSIKHSVCLGQFLFVFVDHWRVVQIFCGPEEPELCNTCLTVHCSTDVTCPGVMINRLEAHYVITSIHPDLSALGSR